jgi:class 3 adenylate cyclase
MAAALELHDEILRGCVEDAAGAVVKTMGDGVVPAFETETDAFTAALARRFTVTMIISDQR